jgi:hypothetical protein
MLRCAEREGADELNELVRDALDRGDLTILERAVGLASAGMAAAAVDGIEWAISTEAQSVFAHGTYCRLFCLPLLVSGTCDARLPAKDIYAMLEMLRGLPGERLCILGDWIHVHDLTGMDPVDYRKLTTDLAESAVAGAKIVPVPAGMFPRSSAGSFNREGAATIWGISGGQHASRTVTARFIVGMVVGADHGGCGHLATGDLPEGFREMLGIGLSAAIPGFLELMAPGQPLEAAVDGLAMLETIILEARLDGAATLIGRRPICHFCIEGDTLHVVLTRDGSCAVDSVSLSAIGMNADVVGRILEDGSAGLVRHETRSSLPKAASVLMS